MNGGTFLHQPDTSRDAPEGRDAFFDRIARQHAQLLYRVAYSVLRHPEDAEDAVADALTKLLRGEAWRAITNERAFLTRTVWRSALDRFEARPPRSEGEEAALAVDDRRPTPEQLAAGSAERRLLHAWMDRLPAELRTPLLLSAVEELNSREIGKILHLPEGTVRTRLMRARAALRQQYECYRKERRPLTAAHGAQA